MCGIISRGYDFKKQDDFSKIAIDHVTQYILKSYDEDSEVINVENELEYQKKDIDLLVIKPDKSIVTVEVKGDKWFEHGGQQNYFFETISNTTTKTKGCFLTSEADYWFYYFVYNYELHILPLKEVRQWVNDNYDKLQTKNTNTKSEGIIIYGTEGKIVPRKWLRKEIPNIMVRNTEKYIN